MYPCRAGPGDLQSRAVAAGPAQVTEFLSRDFDNPQHRRSKQIQERKGITLLSYQRPWEGGWAEILNLEGWPWAGLRV